MRNSQSGVTLMELLTVIVILGVLSSIAVPSYRSYMLRSNRSDAKSALMQVQAAQEKFYIQNNSYSSLIDTASPTGLGMSTLTANRFYSLSVALGPDGQSYTVTATPTDEGGQENDTKCGNFTLTDTGSRGATGSSGTAACWK